MPFRLTRSLLAITWIFASPCCICLAQTTFSANPTRFLVCDKGVGSFQGKLPDGAAGTGVTVSVTAAKQTTGFAARACEAKLTWGHHELVVTPQAAQADIDVMGANLGLGPHVVSFQIKESESDPRINYEIYSLTKPPQLLRTIRGEDFFSAADTLLDGRVEIWTRDKAAIDGFEGLPLSAFDSPPIIVLRFEKKKLIDVSSEFRPFFDHQIENLRVQLDRQQLADFKQSDGKLSNERTTSDASPRGLVATKIKVLEIVWSYIYSGREQQAWKALAEMWPASDVDRIHAAITAAQSRGLRAQVDGVSHTTLPFRQGHREEIYEGLGPTELQPEDPSRHNRVLSTKADHVDHADTAPVQILLKIPPPQSGHQWGEGKQVELVIDEAGKVRSAHLLTPLIGKNAVPEASRLDSDWLAAAAGWKYIPAFKHGRPRAFRFSLFVQRDQ
jgi:hypothetical protein